MTRQARKIIEADETVKMIEAQYSAAQDRIIAKIDGEAPAKPQSKKAHRRSYAYPASPSPRRRPSGDEQKARRGGTPTRDDTPVARVCDGDDASAFASGMGARATSGADQNTDWLAGLLDRGGWGGAAAPKRSGERPWAGCTVLLSLSPASLCAACGRRRWRRRWGDR